MIWGTGTGEEGGNTNNKNIKNSPQTIPSSINVAGFMDFDPKYAAKQAHKSRRKVTLPSGHDWLSL